MIQFHVLELKKLGYKTVKVVPLVHIKKLTYPFSLIAIWLTPPDSVMDQKSFEI